MKVLIIQKMAGVAGSENYFLNLLPRLVMEGIDAHFLSVQASTDASKNDKFIQKLRGHNVRVHIINSDLALSWSLIWAIRDLIVNERFDVVQTNLIHADVWGAIIKKFMLPDLVLVSVKHGYSEKYQAKYGFNASFIRLNRLSFLTRWSSRRADRVVAISEGLKNFLVAAKLVECSQCCVIPHGLASEARPKQALNVSLRFGAPQLLIVARLVESKQHHLVLSIMPELVKRFPSVKLVVVGDGPLDSELRAYSDKLGIAQNVVWEGFRSNVNDYMEASDVVILPSAAEGFGLVVLEAWRNMAPIVAFDVPALNEIINDGETGLLIPPFDTRVLLDKLSYLIEKPEFAKMMAKKGNEVFRERYAIESMVDTTISMYADVIRKKVQGRRVVKCTV